MSEKGWEICAIVIVNLERLVWRVDVKFNLLPVYTFELAIS